MRTAKEAGRMRLFSRLLRLSPLLILMGALAIVTQAAQEGSPPEVVRVIFPAEAQINVGEEQNGLVRFRDRDGDATRAEFVVLTGDASAIQVKPDFSFELAPLDREQERFRFSIVGVKPQEQMELQVLLIDSAGHRSPDTPESRFSFTVVGVANQPPVARFSFSPAQPRVGEVITFDASASSDPDGRITRYSWDFGDETRRVSDTPSTDHVYRQEGTFRVTLIVTDDLGTDSQLAVQTVIVLAAQAGRFIVLKFIKLEFLEPEAWEVQLRERCLVYRNISDRPARVRVTTPDGTVSVFEVLSQREVFVCGDVVHIDTGGGS